MKEKIEDLEAKLEAADARDQEYWKLKEQNEMFHAYYDFKQEHVDFDLQPAKINAKDSGNYLLVLTINKGEVHNIKKDMPVIASVGMDKVIVGYVSEVGFLYSKVTSFMQTGEAIGAYIKSTDETGVIVGDFDLEKKGQCRLEDLPKDTKLKVTDRIYSSGGGGIYPEGLYIGEVIDVQPDAKSHAMVGIIQSAVNFNEIKDVMVVLSFERKFY
jgi:rod shape-determining protein MreC